MLYRCLIAFFVLPGNTSSKLSQISFHKVTLIELVLAFVRSFHHSPTKEIKCKLSPYVQFLLALFSFSPLSNQRKKLSLMVNIKTNKC